MTIKSWPVGERPREKLLDRGAAALTDAELLALLLRTGSRGQDALELARGLLTRFGSLRARCSRRNGRTSRAPQVWGRRSTPAHVPRAGNGSPPVIRSPRFSSTRR